MRILGLFVIVVVYLDTKPLSSSNSSSHWLRSVSATQKSDEAERMK